MAGIRHTGDGSAPTQAEQRAARRRARLQSGLAAARTPSDKIAAAADFTRGIVKHAEPADAAHVADQAVRALVDLGEQLLPKTAGRAA